MSDPGVKLLWFIRQGTRKFLRFETMKGKWRIYDQTEGSPVNWMLTAGRYFFSLDECKSFLAENGWFTENSDLMEVKPMITSDIKRVNNWTFKLMRKAFDWAKESKDPSTKVGAVIADRNNIVRGSGYNGFPRGVDDSPERYANREVKYKMVVHAELNAILNSNGGVRGCTIYSTFFPCPQCAAAIIQSGITMVVAASNSSDLRYNDDIDLSKNMFNEAGVTYMIIQPLDAA